MKHLKKTVFTTLISIGWLSVFSQGLPPIFEKTKKQHLKVKVLAEYPKNTFLENLVKGNDGRLYVTNYPAGQVYNVSLSGDKELYTQVPGKIAGIARYDRNQFLVTGWDTTGKPSVFLINSNKQSSIFANIPSGMFPNGIVHFKENRYLIADSYAGCIWELNTDTKKVSLWVKSPLLERTTPSTQNPAANGLKLYHNSLYVANTDKQILIKIPIVNVTAGQPVLFMDKIAIDDFDFDSLGNIYAATHVYNSVVKITPEKTVTIIADLAQGLAGSTAVLFDKSKKQPVLYVTTEGGMAIPPPEGTEGGKIVIIQLPHAL